MLSLFVSAFTLGLLFNALPGAVLAESLRRGLSGGFRPAFAVQVGSLLGDLTWAVLGLAGAAALFTLPAVERPLALAGAALLGWMAWNAFRDAARPMPAAVPASGQNSALLAGAALSLSNPLNVTYWAALGGTITALGVDDLGGTAFAVFLAGFMASSVLWCVIAAGAIGWAHRRLTPLAWRVLNLGCGIGLAAFATGVAVQAVTAM